MLWWFIILGSLYCATILYMIYVWGGRLSHSTTISTEFVSVVVPFRNEVSNLPRLVKALQDQAYDNFEVLFIDDHSNDGSLKVLYESLEGISFSYKVLDLKGRTGKKAAIALGVAEASGDIILTTDADCIFKSEWVSTMVGAFVKDHVKMVSGPVKLNGNSLFQRWQQMEFSVLIATGAVGIALKKPGMANGANLAYRKKIFEAVRGFEGINDIASGDDELLLMKINELFPQGIRFVKSREAVVETEAINNWRNFHNQRIRWAGKWRYGNRFSAITGALAVFIYNLTLIALPMFAVLFMVPGWLVLAVFASRFFAELLLVIRLSAFFQYRISPIAFLIHQILYPFYAVYFGVAANFGKYNWKGRIYSSRVQ